MTEKTPATPLPDAANTPVPRSRAAPTTRCVAQPPNRNALARINITISPYDPLSTNIVIFIPHEQRIFDDQPLVDRVNYEGQVFQRGRSQQIEASQSRYTRASPSMPATSK